MIAYRDRGFTQVIMEAEKAKLVELEEQLEVMVGQIDELKEL